jgi:hypothetical protein
MLVDWPLAARRSKKVKPDHWQLLVDPPKLLINNKAGVGYLE